MHKVIIWGASGHAKVLREFIGALGYELVALFDTDPKVTSPFADVPLYYGMEGFERWRETCLEGQPGGLVAIGGARGKTRLQIQELLGSKGVMPVTAIHPTAFVADNAIVALGGQVLVNSTVCVNVQVGKGCIINTAASVDHDCVLGVGVHIAPRGTLAGCVTVGDFSFVGAGAVVLPRIHIGANVIVGAGSVVTRNVPDGKVVYGNPARIIRDNVCKE